MPSASPALSAQEHGETLVAPLTSFAFYAFVGGIALAVVLYRQGFATAHRLLQFSPLRVLHQWLSAGMYFDELYFAVFAAIVLAFSYFAAFFDRIVVDGIVRLLSVMVRGGAFVIGWTDDHVVDGAVSGAATMVYDLGIAVRKPQNGRIRVYVTALMIAVVVGLAGAIVLVLSH